MIIAGNAPLSEPFVIWCLDLKNIADLLLAPSSFLIGIMETVVSTPCPLMMVMPGYDMMWFGGESSGSNLDWDGFLCWTQLQEDMIVVSAQLTDWHDTSAWQAIELTEYFLANFSVDVSRVYAAGYSAGGETMSQAVPMRPDLYAAYLHGA